MKQVANAQAKMRSKTVGYTNYNAPNLTKIIKLENQVFTRKMEPKI